MTQAPRFEAILDSVEVLSPEGQELIIDLMHRQLVERRRADAVNINKAQEEYQAGKVYQETVDELIAKSNE